MKMVVLKTWVKNLQTKQDIRKILLKKRNSLTDEQYKTYGKLIEEKILYHPFYAKADTLLIYVSYQKEVPTHGIIKNALALGKHVFCPKVLSAGIMEFYKITSLEDIVCGFKNIPEPISLSIPYSPISYDNTLMIMPLVGFDNDKNRIGYGGGFYDRYLKKNPFIARIGLAYECQKYDFLLPIEENDIKPDFIITELTDY